MLDSCSFTHQFKLNFLETEKVAIGHLVSSDDISAGGHVWRILCYPPRGDRKEYNGKYLSIYLKHESESESVKAMLEATVMDKDGNLSSSHRNCTMTLFTPKGSASANDSWGWDRFVERSVLESLYVTNGSFIIMCGAKVLLDNDPLKVPPSDMGSHLGLLLDCAEGSDVSFLVDGDKFPAHRAVLAARSPVFKAQLLGSMAEANMSSITLHDIAPATFKLMLRFMYTDACPADAELGDSPDEMFRLLLAAADRFALDRLKLLCASKLWDNVSVHTVADTLICAETYNCPGLKKKCIDFVGEEKNFKGAVLTDGFAQLVLKFPSILDELRAKVGL
jgi:speckle-type POZ protein